MFGRYLIVDPKYYFACICILDVQSVLTLLIREGKKKKRKSLISPIARQAGT